MMWNQTCAKVCQLPQPNWKFSYKAQPEFGALQWLTSDLCYQLFTLVDTVTCQ